MSLVSLGRPAMTVLSDQEILKQASEFAVKGLAGQIIEANKKNHIHLSESQAVAIETALRLILTNQMDAARVTLDKEKFPEKFVSEFIDLVTVQLKQAA